MLLHNGTSTAADSASLHLFQPCFSATRMAAGSSFKIGGSSIEGDWEFASPANAVRTVVLVGRTGNGKSASGNSILGRRAFESRASSSCELQSTILRDGRKVNVIDTPGLFDFSVRSEFIEEEIMKFIDLAMNGIHAVLIVFSARIRFSLEEEAALRSLQAFFGEKIVNYMIVVFTGGDKLEENEETLEDYLGPHCPRPLKDFVTLCGNRRVLFDNKTNDQTKRVKQVQELLSLINLVTTQNGGRPRKDELFVELKKGAKRLQDQRFTETVVREAAQLVMEADQREKAVEQRQRVVEWRERAIEWRERAIERRERAAELRERASEQRKRAIEWRETAIEQRETAFEQRTSEFERHEREYQKQVALMQENRGCYSCVIL